MPDVSRKFLVIVTLLCLTGGQWMMLQSAAWAGMLVNHLRHDDSLSTALCQTFDGQHPCPLCKAIERGKSRDENKQVEVKFDHIEFPPVRTFDALMKDDSFQLAALPANEFAESASQSPLLHPPC